MNTGVKLTLLLLCVLMPLGILQAGPSGTERRLDDELRQLEEQGRSNRARSREVHREMELEKSLREAMAEREKLARKRAKTQSLLRAEQKKERREARRQEARQESLQKALYFPGWGHLHRGQTTRGLTWMGAFSLVLIETYLANRERRLAVRAYEDGGLPALALASNPNAAGIAFNLNHFRVRALRVERANEQLQLWSVALLATYAFSVWDSIVERTPSAVSRELPVLRVAFLPPPARSRERPNRPGGGRVPSVHVALWLRF